MPSLLAERARSECARSMRAVEGSLVTLSKLGKTKRRERARPGNSPCSRPTRGLRRPSFSQAGQTRTVIYEAIFLFDDQLSIVYPIVTHNW